MSCVVLKPGMSPIHLLNVLFKGIKEKIPPFWVGEELTIPQIKSNEYIDILVTCHILIRPHLSNEICVAILKRGGVNINCIAARSVLIKLSKKV